MMMLVVIGVTRRVSDLTSSRQALRLTAVMVTTVSLLMVAHLAEILVWSLGYAIVRVAPEGADLVYFAFVNYTTLGYGDIVPLERWRLLGPMTAMTGVLLFGWSTAVIFEVLQKVLSLIESTRAGAGIIEALIRPDAESGAGKRVKVRRRSSDADMDRLLV